jgi:hypothetical protein
MMSKHSGMRLGTTNVGNCNRSRVEKRPIRSRVRTVSCFCSTSPNGVAIDKMKGTHWMDASLVPVAKYCAADA